MNNRQTMAMREAIDMELFPADGTDTQKLRSVGADFNRGDWLHALVIDLLNKHGRYKIDAFVDAMVGMRLGSHGHGPNKMEAERLKGMAHGIWLVQSNLLD